MAEYAISIEKTIAFQGRQEKFSNAYTFSTGVAESFNDAQNITWLVGLEKAVFGSNVNFVTARSYGIGGTDIGNVMREVQDLTGSGTQNGMDLYRECAVLITFELPRSAILRRKRVGRKWLHVGKFKTSPASAGDIAYGQGAIAAADKTFYRTNYADVLTNTSPPGGGEFASHGDSFTNAFVNDYIEHRQFHRGT